MSEILIVDDERALREGLKATLRGEGFDVRTAKDGEDALSKVSEKRPDLVLLDVMMPKMNGFRCCEELRRTNPLLPVIFLTGKDSEADQVRALGLGADDYIAKTESEAVLMARIKRTLERIRQTWEETTKVKGPLLRLGAVSVDLRTHVVTEGHRKIAILTRTEIDILKLLHAHAGEWLVPDDVITELRGNGCDCEDCLVSTYVYRLRHKLGTAADRIESLRGKGYRLNA